MKIDSKTKDKKRRYAPPPHFKRLTLSHALRGKELWLVQVPPGIDVHQLNGTKVKLKNNKAVALSEGCEMFVQSESNSTVITDGDVLPVVGQLTLRKKIKLPIHNNIAPLPPAQPLPDGLKYRLNVGVVDRNDDAKNAIQFCML